MTALRILHVDDEPDIREVVDLSLALDPVFSVRSCDGGRNAVKAAIDWPPDLMLIDVMMPGMDGPATLASLRQTPQTADIPVVFMTARAQVHEVERFKSLGATGVIAKPFDPMTLAATVRDHCHAVGNAVPRRAFVARLRDEIQALEACRPRLSDDAAAAAALGKFHSFAGSLTEAAAVLGLDGLSHLAAALDRAAGKKNGAASSDEVEAALDALIDFVAQL